MGKRTVYADALSRAAVAMGGETRLATALHVPIGDLRRWLRGESCPSTQLYHRVLDLLIGIGSH